MDYNEECYLYFCLDYYVWRRRSIAVLLLMVAIWLRLKDGRRSRNHAPLIERDIWRSNELIRLTQNCDSDGNDSDTIAHNGPTDVDDSVDPSSMSSNKRKRAKSPPKKITKEKVGRSAKVSNEDMAASIKKLADSLAATRPPAYAALPAREDPHANLWRRIDALTIAAKDKLEIATHLSKPDQEHFRSYVNYASDSTLQAWVIDFISSKYDGTD